MRVLLADDDSTLHMVVNIWLSRNGHDMISAKNGQEALDTLQEGNIDILISDVNMPVMDGIELVKKTIQLSTGPRLIIMLTSRCDVSELKSEIDSGKIKLFSKPFSPSELIELIEDVDNKTVGQL